MPPTPFLEIKVICLGVHPAGEIHETFLTVASNGCFYPQNKDAPTFF